MVNVRFAAHCSAALSETRHRIFIESSLIAVKVCPMPSAVPIAGQQGLIDHLASKGTTALNRRSRFVPPVTRPQCSLSLDLSDRGEDTQHGHVKRVLTRIEPGYYCASFASQISYMDRIFK